MIAGLKRWARNPITRKRLRKFRSIRRAWWSFWLLLVLYITSLFANLLCNDKPLLVRYQGKTYFPFLYFYPENTFTGGDKLTAPDYKAIARSEAFASGEGNLMVWAPMPYGPQESIPLETVEYARDLTVTLRPAPVVGRLNIAPDFTIGRAAGVATFFGVPGDDAVNGRTLSGEFQVSAAFREAVAARFRNDAAEAYQENTAAPGGKAALSLSTYKPRSRPPRTVRVTVRTLEDESTGKEKVVFSEQLDLKEAKSRLWNAMHEDQRSEITRLAAERLDALGQPVSLEVGGRRVEIAFERKQKSFPLRPVPGHALGFDSSGRDVLVRMVYANRIALTFGLLLVVVTVFLGICAGAAQGYFGGLVDITAQRFIEIWASLPFLYIIILMGSVFGRSFGLLLIIYGIFNWIGISYYVRGEFLKLRKLPFVEAARCQGIPTRKIIFKHILPNGLVPVITFFPFYLIGAIGSLTALDYLGFGLPAGTPSWGGLLHQAQEFRYAWWLVLYPSLNLFIVMLLGVFIGEGVRSAYDPRVYSRME